MQTGILRTVTLLILTVIGSRNTFSQTTITRGDHSFNINVYRVNDDSPQVTTIVYRNGPLYVVQMEEGRILTFTVDGRIIPTDSLGRYRAVIEDIKEQVRQAEIQAKRDREQADRDREQAERDRVQAGRDREQAERDRGQAEKDRQQAERDRQQAISDREEAERNRSQVDQDRQQAERDRQQAELDRQQSGRDRQQAERDRQQAVLDRQQAERDRIRAEEDRKMLDSLMRDLVADGIVPDRDSVHSLRVNADEIEVNGKRLPEAMEKKYLARYGKKGFSMSINRD